MAGGKRRIWWAVALAAAAVMALGAGTAQAATVQLGNLLAAPAANTAYGTNTTLTNSAVVPPYVAASPVDGTLVSWSFIGGGGGPFVPRVVRPTGGGAYTGAGSGAGQANVPYPAVSGPFATSLPIKAGDLFGVNVPGGDALARRPSIGGTAMSFQPHLADMGAGVPPSATYSDEAELITATVRYCIVPSLRGKSPADARNALTAADCTPGRFKKTKKQRKRKKVLSQSVPPGTSISDTQPVDLKLSRKRR